MVGHTILWQAYVAQEAREETICCSCAEAPGRRLYGTADVGLTEELLATTNLTKQLQHQLAAGAGGAKERGDGDRLFT